MAAIGGRGESWIHRGRLGGDHHHGNIGRRGLGHRNRGQGSVPKDSRAEILLLPFQPNSQKHTIRQLMISPLGRVWAK